MKRTTSPAEILKFPVVPAFFFLIVITGFLIRCIFIWHESLWPDEALYMYIGENLSSDPFALKDELDRPFFQNPPFFMYILSVLFRLTGGGSIKTAHLLTVLLDTGTIILIWHIGNHLYGKYVGFLSALLVALNPLHVWLSTRILNDVPLVFLIYLSLYFLIRQKNALFYLFSTLSLATKYSAAPIFILPFVNKRTILRAPQIWSAIYLLAVAIIICFLTFRSNLENYCFSYFSGFIGMPDFKELYRETYFFLDIIVGLLFLIGFGLALKNKDFSPVLVWVVLFGTARFFLPWVAFRVSRYSIPLYPAVLMFAAHGGIKSFACLKKLNPKRTVLLTVVFCSILLYVILVYFIRGYRVTKINSRTFVGYKEAGNFLANQGDGKSILTSSPRQIKCFAPELTVYDLPKHVTFEEIQRFMIKKEIDFFSVDRWSPHQPDWCRDFSLFGKGFRPVYHNENIVIFAVLPDKL